MTSSRIGSSPSPTRIAQVGGSLEQVITQGVRSITERQLAAEGMLQLSTPGARRRRQYRYHVSGDGGGPSPSGDD